MRALFAYVGAELYMIPVFIMKNEYFALLHFEDPLKPAANFSSYVETTDLCIIQDVLNVFLQNKREHFTHQNETYLPRNLL